MADRRIDFAQRMFIRPGNPLQQHAILAVFNARNGHHPDAARDDS